MYGWRLIHGFQDRPCAKFDAIAANMADFHLGEFLQDVFGDQMMPVAGCRVFLAAHDGGFIQLGEIEQLADALLEPGTPHHLLVIHFVQEIDLARRLGAVFV